MSDFDNRWIHKDEWKRHGKDFLVIVSRHTSGSSEESSGCYDAEGVNRWCIYAYIYPKHPRFVEFVGDNMWQDAAELGFHGGCSYLRRHHGNDGSQTAIQVGCDYNHLGDWEYTQYATPEEARSVFQDADAIFDRLEVPAKQREAV